MDKKNKIKILLIDDDAMNCIYFKDIFWMHDKDNNYDVSVLNTIREAEKLLEDEENKPNIIFLDTLIPEEKEKNDVNSQIDRSYNFAKKIKKDKKFSDIRLVIYSSQRDSRIKKYFSKIKLDGFIFKGDLLPKEIIDFTNKIHGNDN